MKIRQGTAPTVLYRDGRKIWEFTAGHMDLRPFDPDIYALLLQRGAEPEEPVPTTPVEAPAEPEAPEPPSAPRKRNKA